MAVLYLEAEDIAHVFQGLAGSQEPFDVLFRQQTKDFFGFDLAQPLAGPLPMTILIGEQVDKEAHDQAWA